jgi:hypothetical protein
MYLTQVKLCTISLDIISKGTVRFIRSLFLLILFINNDVE